jgi:hypothetical protein
VIELLRPERLGRSLPQQKEGEMNQVEKAARFAELHVKGAPLLLYNAWDAGTAKSILDAGAKAIATSSALPDRTFCPGTSTFFDPF